ncbi:MAG: NlpC/P60 family protein [Rhodobacteraceae bacterium]|nr:NlpC/P60 family protein [Paracoccaceae bacterium]
MTDPRLTASNGRVASIELKGRVAAERYVEGGLRQCIAPIAGLHSSPQGTLSCQLLFGDRFRVLEEVSGWAFGQSERDRYAGYVQSAELGACGMRTHAISTLSTHIYPLPEMKTAPRRWLPYAARIGVRAVDGGFAELAEGGFIPSQHIRDDQAPRADFVHEAKRFLDVPYLWGGNGPTGVDCSGLVQLALNAVGIRCPRDSDMQFSGLGEPVRKNALKPGDLAFWNGHVGVVCAGGMLLHATAHAMAVVQEPLADVCRRLEQGGEAGFLGFRRIRDAAGQSVMPQSAEA